MVRPIYDLTAIGSFMDISSWLLFLTEAFACICHLYHASTIAICSFELLRPFRLWVFLRCLFGYYSRFVHDFPQDCPPMLDRSSIAAGTGITTLRATVRLQSACRIADLVVTSTRRTANSAFTATYWISDFFSHLPILIHPAPNSAATSRCPALAKAEEGAAEGGAEPSGFTSGCPEAFR